VGDVISHRAGELSDKIMVVVDNTDNGIGRLHSGPEGSGSGGAAIVAHDAPGFGVVDHEVYDPRRGVGVPRVAADAHELARLRPQRGTCASSDMRAGRRGKPKPVRHCRLPCGQLRADDETNRHPAGYDGRVGGACLGEFRRNDGGGNQTCRDKAAVPKSGVLERSRYLPRSQRLVTVRSAF